MRLKILEWFGFVVVFSVWGWIRSGRNTARTEYRIHYRTPGQGRPGRVLIEDGLPSPDAVQDSVAAWSSLNCPFEVVKIDRRSITYTPWADAPDVLAAVTANPTKYSHETEHPC